MSKRKPLNVITNCNDCGVCCMEQTALPIHLAYDESNSGMTPCAPLPPELREELLALRAKWDAEDSWPEDGSPCIWFDQEKRQCKHYEHRPTLCRDAVKVGDESCRKWRRAYGVDRQLTFRMVRGKIVKA